MGDRSVSASSQPRHRRMQPREVLPLELAQRDLLSARGGDYELTLGQDVSIGYAFHEKHEVELYVTSSFTFRVLEPAAAVHLKRDAPAARHA